MSAPLFKRTFRYNPTENRKKIDLSQTNVLSFMVQNMKDL